jgi:hypothetical protein
LCTRLASGGHGDGLHLTSRGGLLDNVPGSGR